VVFVKARIGEGDVGNAVRDERDLLVGIVINFAQHTARAFGHDNNACRHVDQLGENTPLVGIGFFQNGMQGGDDGHARAAQQAEEMAAGRTAEDAELVLHAERVDVGEIEEIGRAHVGRHVGLGDLEADVVRVFVFAGPVGDGNDRAAPSGVGLGHRVAQIAGEGGDTALARRIVAEKSHLADLRIARHAGHCRLGWLQANEKFPHWNAGADHDGIAMASQGRIMKG